MQNHRYFVSSHPGVRSALASAAAGLLCAVTPAAAFSARAAAPVPELILYNGHVFTADPAHPRAQAIAILGERIVAVGTDTAVRGLAGASSRLVDLQGRTVIPGINDAHAHLGVWAKSWVSADADSADPDWPTLSGVLRKAAETAPEGTPIFATIGSRIFRDPAIVRSSIDAIVSDKPVVLTDFDGHGAILNSAALKLLDIGDDIADPAGGRFERDADGHLNGVAREYAASDIGRRASGLVSDQDAMDALTTQLQRAARYGITTIQEMPVDVDASRFTRLAQAIPMPVRLRVTRMNQTTPAGPDYLEGQAASSQPTPLVSVNGTKWVLDGVIFEGSFTPRQEAAAKDALPAGPYSFVGLPPLFAPSVVEEMLRDSLQHGYQLQFHVFGRPAALELFDALEKTGGRRVWVGRRLRIEHGDGLTPDLIARAKSFGIVVSQQGTHFIILQTDTSLDAGFLDRLRASQAQPLRSLLTAGVPLALGSDGPLNPWLGILGAVTHPDRPTEAITIEQAIDANTHGSAYAEFAEKVKGRLTPGQLADLAVLSQDVFKVPASSLAATTSVLTLVGGRVTWDAHVLQIP
jgi:predicted amidohydrolase YtcJ